MKPDRSNGRAFPLQAALEHNLRRKHGRGFVFGALFIALLPSAPVWGQLTIDTVAANGQAGFSGDGGPATNAQVFLFISGGITADGQGNFYFADQGNQRIRKVASDGIITTVAGLGASGSVEDGIPATEAHLRLPGDVELDSQDNLYIAETGFGRVRKIDVTGTITTVAGNGTLGDTGDGGPATEASMLEPTAVALDGQGRLYIVDQGAHRIRVVTEGIIETYAGTGVAGYSGDNGPATAAMINAPGALVLDQAGNLYFTQTRDPALRRIGLDGAITTVAGTGVDGFSGDGGPATAAQLSSPRGVALDSSGNIYISDTGNLRIRRINTSGVISTVAGDSLLGFAGDGGPAEQARLSFPAGLADDGRGGLLVVDSQNFRIRRLAGLPIKADDRIEIRHSDGDWWLIWMTGTLQEASDILGPWQVITDAVSPHRLTISLDAKKFFRTSRATPGG